MKLGRWLLLSCLGAALFACSQPNRSLPDDIAAQPSAAPVTAPAPVTSQASASDSADPASPFRLTASIRELMDSEVDPAADFIWGSVASISTRAGLEEAGAVKCDLVACSKNFQRTAFAAESPDWRWLLGERPVFRRLYDGAPLLSTEKDIRLLSVPAGKSWVGQARNEYRPHRQHFGTTGSRGLLS